MADWSRLGKVIGELGTPAGKILGGLIGGPAGAAIGSAAGSILAGALGVDETPESVAGAVKANPMQANDVIASDNMQAAIAQAQAEALKTINETYRIELQNESWVVRLWRPVCGWCFTVILTIHGLAYAKALWFRDFEIIRTIPDMTIFYGVFGAVVGVYAWGRTAEKKAAAASGGAPEAIAEAIGAVVKKVARK